MTPVIDTNSVSSGANFDQQLVDGLPMFSNMPIMLARFAPGVNPMTNAAGVPGIHRRPEQRGRQRPSAASAATTTRSTARPTPAANRRLASSPNTDMIQEMRVETSNFDAAIGHGTGQQISMMTTRGHEQDARHGQLSVLDQRAQLAQRAAEDDVRRRLRRAGVREGPVAQLRRSRSAGRSSSRSSSTAATSCSSSPTISNVDDSMPGRNAGTSTVPANAEAPAKATSPICCRCRTRTSTSIYDPLTRATRSGAARTA